MARRGLGKYITQVYISDCRKEYLANAKPSAIPRLKYYLNYTICEKKSNIRFPVHTFL